MPGRAICMQFPKAQHRLLPAGRIVNVEGRGHLHCYLQDIVNLLYQEHRRIASKTGCISYLLC